MQRIRIAALIVLVLLAAACDSTDPLERARELQANGMFEESRVLLETLVEERGEEPEIHLLYGLSLMRTNRPSQAVWPLRRAMEHPEWRSAAALHLASGALETGNFDEAVELATVTLEGDPDDELALLLRSIARIYTRRDYEGALADADRLLELEPDNPQAPAYRAIALLALERREEAAEALEELERSASQGVVAGPMAAGFCGARGKFAQEKGELEEAERIFTSCLEQHPANGLLLAAAIEFFDGIGKPERATAALRDAQETVPQARDLRARLAVRLERLGDPEGAEALLRSATQDANPAAAASAYADLAGYLAEHERFAEAVESYRAALEVAPGARSALAFRYAEALILAGEVERALEITEEIRVPAERHLIAGRALFAQGKLQEALARFTQGIELWPNQPMARYYAAVIAERLGNFDRAIEEYRYAIRAGALLEARVALARLHQAEGDTTLALAAIRHNPNNDTLEPEAALLELELLANQGPAPPPLRPSLRTPQRLGQVLAARATGTRRRAGPAAAAQIVLDAKQLNLAAPSSLPALAGLIDDLLAIDRSAQGLALIERILPEVPESPALLALHGEALERSGKASRSSAVYARALELDPDSIRALRGQARLALAAEDVARALELYDRAAAAATVAGEEDAISPLAAAEIRIRAGRADEAIERLEVWLAEHPRDAGVALKLAKLLELESPEAALRHTQRAARMGAGAEAEALLKRLSSADAASPTS